MQARSSDRVNRTRLLFVNLHYAPDNAATAQLLGDIAEYLAHLGYSTEVLCGKGRYIIGQVDAPAREVREGVKVLRVPTLGAGRRSHARRILNYAVFYVQVLVRVFAGTNKRYVIYLTTPPLIGFIGFLARHLRRIRYAIWSMDVHPDAAVAAGILDGTGRLCSILRRMTFYSYSEADLVIDLGVAMKKRIAAYGIAEENLQTVNIWSPVDDLAVPREDNPLAQRVGLGDELVVGYSGNAGIAHRFDEVLAAAAELRREEDLRFLFIGHGPRRQHIEEYAAANRIRNFCYLDYFSRDALTCSLSLIDIHLVTLRQSFAGVAVPAKLYGIMAIGRPTIFVGPTECETARTILDAGCGAVIDPYENEAAASELVSTILEWQANPAIRTELGARARQAYLDSHRQADCCRAFESLIHAWTSSSERQAP